MHRLSRLALNDFFRRLEVLLLEGDVDRAHAEVSTMLEVAGRPTVRTIC